LVGLFLGFAGGARDGGGHVTAFHRLANTTSYACSVAQVSASCHGLRPFSDIVLGALDALRSRPTPAWFVHAQGLQCGIFMDSLHVVGQFYQIMNRWVQAKQDRGRVCISRYSSPVRINNGAQNEAVS